MDGVMSSCNWMEMEVKMGGDICTDTLKITPEILKLIAEIDEFKGAWMAIGRLSRILTTLLLLRSGYAYVPYSSLESFIEQSKDAYYLALRRTQQTVRTTEPNWQPWVSFFLRSLQQQKAHLEKKIEQERLILGDLPELSVQILELCRHRGRVTVAEVVKVTGANRNTIKDHLKALTRVGHLTRHGAGRGSWYDLA
jgi:Fic family protein